MRYFDALVVGSGVAGSTSAAALAKRGLSVLLCDASAPDAVRPFGGETMHPVAAGHLAHLGLLEPLTQAGAVPLYGLVIFDRPEGSGTVVPFPSRSRGGSRGITMPHASLVETLLGAVQQRYRVEVWRPASVVSVDRTKSRPVALIQLGREKHEVVTPLVVAAEGRRGAIRESLGISAELQNPMRLAAWNIPNARLPYPGYRHVFTGGPRVAIAYQTSSTTSRVLFDVSEGPVTEHDIGALPLPFRRDVQTALDSRPPVHAEFGELMPTRFSRGAVAVVGDAGGCSHPVMASGLAACTGSAMHLARCIDPLFDGPGDIEQRLRRYDTQRRSRLRGSAALGAALGEAFGSQSRNELSRGLADRLQHATRTQLLAGRELNLFQVATEYAALSHHELTALSYNPASLMGVARGVRQLARAVATWN